MEMDVYYKSNTTEYNTLKRILALEIQLPCRFFLSYNFDHLVLAFPGLCPPTFVVFVAVAKTLLPLILEHNDIKVSQGKFRVDSRKGVFSRSRGFGNNAATSTASFQ